MAPGTKNVNAACTAFCAAYSIRIDVKRRERRRKHADEASWFVDIKPVRPSWQNRPSALILHSTVGIEKVP
jgi:hypothetical protein